MSTDFKSFRESFLTKRSNLTLVILALITFALLLTFRLAQQRQEIRQKAAGNSVMTLVPSKTTVAPGEEFTVNVDVTTGPDQVFQSTVKVNYDPTKLEGVSVVPGAFMPTELPNKSIGNGVAFIDVATADTGGVGASTVNGTGTVAVITFRALGVSGATPVTVAGDATVIGLIDAENFENVLDSTVPTTITVSATAFQSDIDLTMSPSTQQFAQDQVFTVDVNIDSGTNTVATGELVINFPGNLLELQSAQNGTFLPTAVVSPEITANSVKIYNAYLGAPETRPQGQGLLARLTFKALAIGVAPISFDGTTRVFAYEDTEFTGLIQSVQGSTTTIVAAGTASPAPSTSPTATASPGSSTSPAPSDGTGGTQVNNNPPVNTSAPTACTEIKPNRPTNVSAVAGTARGTVTVFWDKQQSANGYFINYSERSGVDSYGVPDTGDESSYTIGGLVPGRLYYFRVYAKNGCMPSNGSAEASARAAGSSGSSGGFTGTQPTEYVYPTPDVVTDPYIDPYAPASVEPLPSDPNLMTPDLTDTQATDAGLLSGSNLISFLKILLIVGSIMAILYLIYTRFAQSSDRTEEAGPKN